MLFYNNYCELKKAEVLYNELIEKNLNLKEISKISNPFISCFSDFNAAYERVFNFLITFNTRFNKISTYTNITEESKRGKEILNFLLVNKIVKPEYLTNKFVFNINNSSISLNSVNNEISINLGDTCILTTKKNNVGETKVFYNVIKKDNKDYLLESKSITSKVNGNLIFSNENILTDINSHKIEYYNRKSSIRNQNITYLNNSSKAYLIKNTGKELFCLDIDNKPIAYSNNIYSSINALNVKGKTANAFKKAAINQINGNKQIFNSNLAKFENNVM